MKNFSIPPISTLIGSTAGNYFRVMKTGRVESRYYLKVFLSTLIIFIGIPFHIWEKITFAPKLKRFKMKVPPLFILGHWRSGTTFLHNVLCQDPHAGYLTTFQSVFPNNLGSKLLFKNFMKWNMPDKRPSDNVRLNINYPQEDEFALGNLLDDAYYNFFYFPEDYKIHFEGVMNNQDSETWKEKYRTMLEKALINTGGTRAIIKNPVSTIRIRFLLGLYPDAKFIFIYRNPVTVFLSARRFFHQLMPTLWFHEVSEEEIDNMILEIFPRMIDHYYATRDLIPDGNLLEIKFEEFEKDPPAYLERIYTDLLEDEYSRVNAPFKDYLDSLKGYKKNSYEVPRKLIEQVEEKWGKYMKKWGYEIPEEIVLV